MKIKILDFCGVFRIKNVLFNIRLCSQITSYNYYIFSNFWGGVAEASSPSPFHCGIAKNGHRQSKIISLCVRILFIVFNITIVRTHRKWTTSKTRRTSWSLSRWCTWWMWTDKLSAWSGSLARSSTTWTPLVVKTPTTSWPTHRPALSIWGKL